MSRQINNKEKSKPIFITSIVLGVLAAFVLLLSIVQKDASFLVSLIGLVGLILLMNIAQRLNINKEKIKMWSIICIILLIIAIPLLIKYVIFSLMLSIPTFILTKKNKIFIFFLFSSFSLQLEAHFLKLKKCLF